MGEPRTPNSENEWSGGTAEERKVLNKYHKVFVDTVRATGGNNANRCLIIPTYAAKPYEWVLNDIEIPNNDKKVIVDIHAYEPWDFTMDITSDVTKFDYRVKSDVDNLMNTVYDCLVKKGIQVVIGEFGNNNKRNTSVRAKYTSYYISSSKKLEVVEYIEAYLTQANKYGIATYWFDPINNIRRRNLYLVVGSRYLQRTGLRYIQPQRRKGRLDGGCRCVYSLQLSGQASRAHIKGNKKGQFRHPHLERPFGSIRLQSVRVRLKVGKIQTNSVYLRKQKDDKGTFKGNA